MADEESRLLSSNEGAGSEGTIPATIPAGFTPVSGSEVLRTPEQQQQPNSAPGLTAEELQRLPPELRPGPDGKPPVMTEKLLRQMRGHYFTVKHVLLEQCGHRLDMITEPRTGCENCWWQWFLHHPQLVETTDQFYRTQGKGPLIAMRGKKYVTMFGRFMATYIRMAKEEAALKAAQESANVTASQSQPDSGTLDDGTYIKESGEVSQAAGTFEG